MNNYEYAKQEYAKFSVNTEDALRLLKNTPISIHCWQGDDVIGLDGGGALSGGIQTTGNYPGRARNFNELKEDIKKAFSLMPGKKRLNLHASYAILEDEKVDRDAYEPKHFAKWVAFAKEIGLDGIDFNPTLFSHKKVKDGLTLSSPDEEVRKFWIRHCQACIKISEYFANQMKTPCAMNIWIPDGFKDIPADRLTPRLRLKASLDEILAIPYDRSKVIIAVESKVFGIGVESYTVGSNEFYQIYAAKNNICCLLDNGHYHPLEYVSDKIPALLAFYDKLALHVTRGVRWDSDHVVLLEDEIKEIAKEIVRNNALDKVMIALDYFDASINRISAWVTGQRAMQKALLYALLMNHKELKALQEANDFTSLMVKQEEYKTLPFGSVWEEYLKQEGMENNYLKEIKAYEDKVLRKRG
ncbi:MAG: L-rhamnose isomerase [Roseburia sp.]|nr:L-rhamnose isomerase [Anaeroplasma bactoclasticum]MCM1195552.1 L-rhamnose isomerase [Roseburia sp.]MCM1555967.1 L-rhamnose isomerase [Anaeroplasma bactoclasticum]